MRAITDLALAAIESLDWRREEARPPASPGGLVTRITASRITSARFGAIQAEYSTLREWIHDAKDSLQRLRAKLYRLQEDRTALYLLAASLHRALPAEPARQTYHPRRYIVRILAERAKFIKRTGLAPTSVHSVPTQAVLTPATLLTSHQCPADPTTRVIVFRSLTSHTADLWRQQSALQRDLDHLNGEVSHLEDVVTTLMAALSFTADRTTPSVTSLPDVNEAL
jgi:hypothetical protein